MARTSPACRTATSPPGESLTRPGPELFPEMSVYRQRVCRVPFEARGETAGHPAGRPGRRSETGKSPGEVQEVLGFTGIREFQQALGYNLPFGIGKMVQVAPGSSPETARAALDEPSAGMSAGKKKDHELIQGYINRQGFPSFSSNMT